MKILLAEDDEDIREMLADDIKEDYGIEVLQAKNGMEAAEIIESTKIDILVADIFMPPMDGIELLKKYADTMDMFIISGSLERKDECMGLGAKGFIQKPFTQKQLLEKIFVDR